MDYIGVDLGETSSQLCVIAAGGELIERRIKTTREQFDTWLGSRPPARILIEATTESERVARHPERLGHEVIVADPNFAAMYATRSRRVKTDRRDARTLCEACRLGGYRPAHRASEAQRQVRRLLMVRETLVRARAKYVTTIKTLVRPEGLRVAASESRRFLERLSAVTLPEHLAAALAPLTELSACLNEQIARAGRQLGESADSDPGRRAAARGAGRRGGDGRDLRRDVRRGGAARDGQASAQLFRAGAEREEWWRAAAPWAHHQGGQRAAAGATGGGRLAPVALQAGGGGGHQSPGREAGRAAWEVRGGGRTGAKARRHSLRDVA
jgi:hypothetical protein